jgi:hypothetical protein
MSQQQDTQPVLWDSSTAMDGYQKAVQSNKLVTKRGFQFWMIIVTLCVISLLSSLENTVVATSLPYIVTQLDPSENYIWVTNVLFLTR